MNLATKVLIGLILGAIVGLGINLSGLAGNPWVDQNLVHGIFNVVGKLFVNALKMLVVPLVLFSLIPGILGIGDVNLLGRIGSKAVALYLLTTAVAITFAILFATAFSIGDGMTIPTEASFQVQEGRSFSEVIIGIVPSNPIAALANGDMLAIIFFAIFFGIALLTIAKQAPQLVSFIEQVNQVIMQMVSMVMWFAPIAVFCLVSKALAELGIDLLLQLLEYFLVLAGALLFHMLVIQTLFLKLLTGLDVRMFLKKMRTAQLFAFSSSSSAATIPVTLRTVEKRMGVDNSVASFNVPFGATINMDGTAMMQGVATVFFANIYGIDLGLAGYLMVIVTAVLASIGTAAVPSAGIVMLTIVFGQVGLPIEHIGLILGVDRLLDMLRTSVNVTGDAMVSIVLGKSEGRFDESIYNDPNAGELEEIHLPHGHAADS